MFSGFLTIAATYRARPARKFGFCFFEVKEPRNEATRESQTAQADKRWTDTDDATAFMFPAAEAAEILGRTVAAVHQRRSAKGFTRQHRDKQPRKRLRREFFSTGEGPREEVLPPQPPPKCKYCRQPHFTRGLCAGCWRRVRAMVESGCITWEQAERLWLGPRRNAAPK